MPSRLLLLVVVVQNSPGYLHLSELIALGWVSNAHKAQVWIKWQWPEALGGGLVGLEGAVRR